MNIFKPVSFGVEDIKAVQSGTASRSQILAILTSETCGEACWHAREEICRCSCGGKNHGCLRSANGVQPQRMCTIQGVRYKLEAVGYELMAQAEKINKAAGYRSVEKPEWYEHGKFWVQYKYQWRETDDGAPARLKPASKDQLARWAELQAFKNDDLRLRKPDLLWVREVMPERPTELVIDKETGKPLENQNPQ